MNVYDFDKTIIPYDSTQAFFRYLIKRKPSILLHLPKMGFAFIRYGLKQITKTQMKNIMYEVLPKVGNLNQIVLDFWSTRQNDIHTWYLNQKRNDDIIISASPSFLIKPMCEVLGVNLIASEIDLNTGHHIGENCYGNEKPLRFEKEYDLEDIQAFYSDSYSDTPMAIHAKEAYLVTGENITPWDFRKKYRSYEH
jgi:phosphatidylglycerophosphatase C